MFTQDDVKGIQLERLMAYIVERNKEEKIHREGQIQSAVLDLAGSLYSANSHGQIDSVKVFNRNSPSIYSEIDSASEKTHSIDMIKENEDQHEENSQNDQKTVQQTDQNGIMLTKPQLPLSHTTLVSKKNVKFASDSKMNSTSGKFREQKRQNQSRGPINMKFIMLSLKNHTIDYLKQQFIYNDNEITLERFLYLMKQCISYDRRREYEISYELIKLFEEIDIDCNKSIDWEQFLEYLACYGWTSSGWQMEAGDGVGRDKGKKYHLIVETWNEVNKHRKNPLTKIVYIEKLDMLCLVESKNFALTFLNTRGQKYLISGQSQNATPAYKGQKALNSASQPSSPTAQQRQRTLAYQSSTEELANTKFTLNHIDPLKVLSIDYSQHQKLFGVLQTDRKVHFVQQGQIQKSWGKVQGAGNQIDIMYLPLHRKWLLKRINQYLDIFASPKDKLNNERIVFKPHQTQAITAIKQLKQPFSLITAGIDGKIKIWSLASRQLLIELKPIGEEDMMSISPVKTKGVKGIDTLNVGIQSYFCSWTFTTEIMLWLPSTSVSKPYIGKLHGHSGIVESCEFAKGQHCSKELVVSIDNKKLIKIWSVQKLQCLQSLLHEGSGCRIKCLHSRPAFIVYDKIIEFNRLKLSSLMMGSDKTGNELRGSERELGTEADLEGGMGYNMKGPIKQQHSGAANNQAGNDMQQFVQIEFCNHNILILLLLRTELRVINIQTGRIQAIFEPTFKDDQEFVHMSIKINRRAFIVSNLGYVYYLKLDDASLIKKFEIQLGGKDTLGNYRNNNSNEFSEYGSQQKSPSKRQGKTKNTNYYQTDGKKQSLLQKKYNQPDPFSPKFVYYHSLSKVLLIVVELDNHDSSVLITYNELTGYEFEKMKEIEFPQSELSQFMFFAKADTILISSYSMLTIWDFAKLSIVNKIDFTQLPSDPKSQAFYMQHHPNQSLPQPFVKHIAINENNNNNCLLIIILNRYHDLIFYELHPADYSFRHCIVLDVPKKLRFVIRSFYLLCTNNQEIEGLVSNKFYAIKSKKIIKNTREKHVKFNFSADDPDADPIVQNIQKKDDEHSNPNKQSNRNQTTAQTSLVASRKRSQQNLSLNKSSLNRENKILYFVTNEGQVIGYHFNEIIMMLKKDLNGGDLGGDGKRKAQKCFSTVGFHDANMAQNIEKRYAAHKIRQTRKTTIKQLSNKLHIIGPINFEEYLLIEKELITHPWAPTFAQLYPDLLYGMSEKNELVFLQPTGETLGEWNIKSIFPKRWTVTYQLLPKVIQRLNKLQEILNLYKQSSAFSALKLASNTNFQTQINGSNAQKVLFLANRFLEESDLIELKDYVKMSTVKLLNISKKNILYNKKYGTQHKSKQVISIKKFDDLAQNVSLKKKSVTISKNIIENSIDDNANRSPSMSKVGVLKNYTSQHNQRSSGYALSSFGAKKVNETEASNNFFERKFQQKVGQENRLKVHRKYIDKQVEKTLKQAKQLHLKSVQAQNNRAQAHQNNQQSTQKSINIKPTGNDKKQHARSLIRDTPQHLGHETNGSRKIITSQMNNLMIEQEIQRKEIEKNINFVKKIEESIEKVEKGFTVGGRLNFVEIVDCKQKGVKDQNNNTKKDDAHQHSNKPTSTSNLLKAQETGTRKRKASISNNMPLETISVIPESGQSGHQMKTIGKVKEPLMLTMKDFRGKDIEEKDTQISSQVIINVIKKNFDFSTNNKIIVYDSNDQLSDGQDNTNQFQRRNHFDRTMKSSSNSGKMLLQKSSKRSFSAVGRSSNQQNPAIQHQAGQTLANSPSRVHLKSASNHNLMQGERKSLSKSRSMYGTGFMKQKEMAMSNFKQGMRDFDNFYKRFGNGWGTVASKKNEKSRIKIN